MATKKKEDGEVVESKRTSKNAYRLWLNNKINSPAHPIVAYSQVLSALFRAPFVPSYPGDENRIGDIRELRSSFSNEVKLSNIEYLEIQEMQPMMLELMVTMATRINNFASEDDDISKYFWDMMESLGLKNMDDSKFNYSDVQKRIDIFTNRKYEANGKGGLFWIKKFNDSGYNAPMVDLWTQSQAYLNSIS